MCVLQAHISHPLPCLQYKAMLSHEDEKHCVRRVCKNVSVRTLSLYHSLDQIRVLPGKEEMAPLTHSTEEHLLENTA